MLYTIQNDQVRVTVDSLGAQMQSITAADGTEYLWYGDEAYWRSRATNLFPYVGRPTDGKITHNGKAYDMTQHGFAKRMEFTAVEQGTDRLVLRLTDNDETRVIYPFLFAFDLMYELKGATVQITYRVENRSNERMYFGLGGHPGFRLPLEEGKCFTDYQITFAKPCYPARAELSPAYQMSGVETPYALEENRTLYLRHDLFDHDAIILHHMDKTMTLSAGEGSRGVTMHIPNMNYLGIWHTPETEAPFVCLEPWVSLPSRDGVVEDFSQQGDLVGLNVGETYHNTWSITIF
ncbi:MAG: aldose 1-epimerase family protein [Oscillospiraceae bacterium]|nr:aldose 1-epimerase family protein [Oscillospiraceae bacterium]